jgi:hypothetical protein
MMQVGYVRSGEDGDTFVIFEVDAVMSETHEITATLTDHPVERGADLSDHKRPGQRRYRLEGLVSNTPIGDVPLTGENSTASDVTAEPKESPAKATVLTFSERFDRVRDMLDALTDLTESTQLVTITTDVRTYENAQIVSVVAPRTPDGGDSIAFAVDVVQVRIAETRDVGAPVPRQPRGRRTRDNGSQTGAEAETDPAPDQNSSAAQRIADSELGQQAREAWEGLFR